MFTEKSLTEFASALAGSAPVPGGGGTAALTGALGCALGQMVGSLTTGKKRYADVEEQVQGEIRKLAALREKLLFLTEEDAKVFEPLSRAYGLPKDTPEQAAEKERIMEDCLYKAASVPLSVMETAAEALDSIETLARIGSRLAVSDAGCGAALCRAAIEAASLNVYINTKYMKDPEHKEALEKRTGEILSEAVPKAETVFQSVSSGLKG